MIDVSNGGRISRLTLALLLALSGAAIASRQTPGKVPAPKPAAARAASLPGWEEVDRLVSEQKFEEAVRRVDEILAAARRRGDETQWTRALVREIQLRIGLHGYETAVRFVKDQPWPKGLLPRATLNLFYAQALSTYARIYSWEISRRERIESRGPADLASWTREQIFGEAERALREVWGERASLGRLEVGALSEYLEANTYPAKIRGTLRDAVSYLYVGLLADTSNWTPRQSNEIYRLDLKKLLEQRGDPSFEAILKDAGAHPLEKIAAVLADLESWHAGTGNREAALEARLERLRRLHAAFTEASDRARIRKDLENRLAGSRALPWWAMGMATLAEFREAEDAPDNLVRAREAALEGAAAFPDSAGGRRCAAIVGRIEAPDYRVAAMASDGPGRRSIEVTHKNLSGLFFRAYALDLESRVGSARDYSLLPSAREVEDILRSERPARAWSAALPPTSDFKPHRTFVTPPLEEPGAYVVAVSAREDFAADKNRIESVSLIVTGIVLVTRPETESAEVQALSGETGRALSGVDVALYQFDWREGHHSVEKKTTGADGFARFENAPGRGEKGYFVLARRGKDVALDTTGFSFWKPPTPAETAATLLYTDRSVYRPGQKILWKALLFSGKRDLGRFAALPGETLTISLLDGNGQKVDSKTVASNAFGTASGEFPIPAGRVLGDWRLESSRNGAVSIGVEEYKRPTFEVSWKDPESPLRLNRPAALAGSARYYFGLPVASGSARWRVTRVPEFPWWWFGRRPERAQIVAQGVSRLEADGFFRVTFTPAADERIAVKEKGVTYRYAAAADVTDEGGETRSAERVFRLGLFSVEAEVRMDAHFLREGAASDLTIVRRDLDGSPHAGEGTWRLYAVRQPDKTLLPSEEPLSLEGAAAFQTPGDRLRPRWDTGEPLETILRRWPDGAQETSGTIRHDEKGEGRLSLPPLAAGVWRLRYETVDPFGGKYETAKDFLVAGGKTSVALPAVLLTETSSVPAGGTLRVLALSGFPGQDLALETYRDGHLLDRRRLSGGEGGVVEIPIGEKDRGGLALRLSALRDHQFLVQTQTVLVPWDDRKLEVSFATFRDKLKPGGRETWRVTVKSAIGERSPERAAELLAYMYDRSLDLFRAHAPFDPLSLYPNRATAAPVRASLGETFAQRVSEKGFVFVTREEPPREDRLKFFEGYGVGGPGMRARMLKGGVVGGIGPAPTAEMVVTAQAPVSPEMPSPLAVAKSEAKPAAPAVPLRSEFAETAFWQPHLLTDAQGGAAIEFTVPDSVTSWKVWVHAVTKDLKAGSLQKEVESVKDLMVRPYLPRFLREGDRGRIKVVVNNASGRPLSGRVSLDIRDVETDASALGSFGLKDSEAVQPFTAAPGGGADVAFSVAAPVKVGSYAFRVTAISGDTSDGELRPVPVLPGRFHLLQSRFAALREGDRRELEFPDLRREDPSRINERMVVTVDAQLFYSVLEALPYLVNYPYECTEQIANRFLSTGIVSSLYRDYPAVARMAEELSKRQTPLETWDSSDPNRRMTLEETPWLEAARGGRDRGLGMVNVLDPRAAKAERETSLAKLAKAQTALGGFPWWPGGPPSPYMTLYLMYGFARGAESGVEVPRDMVQRGWQYLARHFREDYAARWMREDRGWEFLTFLNYAASSYPDESWTGGALTAEERKAILDFCFRHWREHSPLLKAQLALTLKRFRRDADARLVWGSVMDSAKTDPDLGTYWAPESRSWLWYNDTIETEAIALRALLEIAPEDPRRHGLVQWLFLNKKLNQWKSTRATAEVIYALIVYLKKEGALSVREEATVAVGPQTTTFVFDPDRYTGKKNQVVVPGEKLGVETSKVTVEKRGKGFAFASATWHFSTERLPEEDRGDFFRVSRRYFLRESGPGGFTLKAVAEGAVLKPGDEIEVQISLSSKHAAEYVHLRDPRAAGLEPEDLVSGYRWDLGIGRYQETRDSGTNFFFEQFPAGEFTLKYRLRANMSGVFRVGPATVQSMYAPEFAAYSSGAILTIR